MYSEGQFLPQLRSSVPPPAPIKVLSGQPPVQDERAMAKGHCGGLRKTLSLWYADLQVSCPAGRAAIPPAPEKVLLFPMLQRRYCLLFARGPWSLPTSSVVLRTGILLSQAEVPLTPTPYTVCCNWNTWGALLAYLASGSSPGLPEPASVSCRFAPSCGPF